MQMGRTPLHLAAVTGSTASVVLLCGMGAAVDVQDSAGVPPLCKAAAGEHPENVSARLLTALGSGMACLHLSLLYKSCLGGLI